MSLLKPSLWSAVVAGALIAQVGLCVVAMGITWIVILFVR